jgi:P-type Ca2+ transporter type 2C
MAGPLPPDPARARRAAPGEAQWQGLSEAQALQRRQEEGPNLLPRGVKRSVLQVLFELMREPMFVLLLAGGAIYGLLGSRLEALLLLAFACCSIGITLLQLSRSDRVMERLRDLASPRARVIRSGITQLIAGEDVVRQDRLLVSEGDRICADARLLQAQDLQLDESLLTGESVAVSKSPATAKGDSPLEVAEPGIHQLFAGTLVVRGSGLAEVTAIGAATHMGLIGVSINQLDTQQAHLQRQLSGLVRAFALIGALAAATVVLLLGLLRGNWLDALLSGIAIGMSLLPEEFPLVMAVFMAMGAWRIAQVRVLTRRASAIETLGATQVLCTDKTGTLTENRMTLMAMHTGEEHWQPGATATLSEALQRLLSAAQASAPERSGDPMDQALARLAGPGQPLPARRQHIGLRPDLLATTSVVEEAGGLLAYSKGALEAIADLCHFSPEQLAQQRARADAFAQAGMRVLAVAWAPDVVLPLASPHSLGYQFLGLLAFADPLREGVPAAVAQCQAAGIRVVMITGDYAVTAAAIAQQAGLPAGPVLSGADMDKLSDAQLASVLPTVALFARFRPQQKLRLVQGFMALGQVVAMTGDGVNDAPAIKVAHIGIAMGGRGTDVAREAAALVLLDDDFGAMVQAIRLGRRIYDNLRKAIGFIVAVHIPIAGLAIVPLLMGLPMMLAPIHIAFLEMLIDPACSVVFEAENDEADIMQRPPRDSSSALLPTAALLWALFQGAVGLVLLGGFLLVGLYQQLPEDQLRAMAFLMLVVFNLGLIFINRSNTHAGFFAWARPNRALVILVLAVSGTLAVALLWPAAQRLFGFAGFNLGVAALCVLATLLTVAVLAVIQRRKK